MVGLANSDGQKNLTDEEKRQLVADLDRLKATGVDFSKLSAGLAAALAGKDIDTAATTGGNAAEHNALIIVPIVLELMDKGLQTYDAYRLAKAIEAGDTDEATNIAAEIALGVATDGITGNVVAIKIASAVEKFGLAALGAKIVGKFGDEAAGVAAKSGLKNTDDVIHVTPDGVALPKGTKIPDHYVENPYGRHGSYGEMVDGKFQEKLRIDPATPPGKKGPNYSHYHKDGKSTHYSPKPGDKNPGF